MRFKKKIIHGAPVRKTARPLIYLKLEIFVGYIIFKLSVSNCDVENYPGGC
jgi:hypothetical protein